ncbi:MAG: NusG domain II-containing protein [Gammaproteobacteria bacterium]|nr:NusG domain II-containing protein [Gammaproteobacteria bacterium]MDH5650371.1 NusG domain II-containing protein [Gammaproteobacteria bacterium]
MTRADLFLLLAVMFALPFVYQASWHNQGTAAQAVILNGKHEHSRHSLHEDRRIEVKGPLGPSHIEIKQGRIRFVDSPCKAKVCIQRGWIDQAGTLNACVPNRIAIRLSGLHEQYDSINY